MKYVFVVIALSGLTIKLIKEKKAFFFKMYRALWYNLSEELL